MSYLYGTPVSGDLFATGNQPVVANAFYLRYSIDNNQLQRAQIMLPGTEITAQKTAKTFVTVFPNPTNNQILVTLKNYDSQEAGEAKLYNELGELVLTVPFNSARFEMDLSHLKNGVYLLQTNYNHTVEITRIIKI